MIQRILIALGLIVLMSSCTIAGVDVPVPGTTSTETSGDPLLSDAGIDKYNAYIGYINQQGTLYKAFDEYFKDVDEETGIPFSKGSVTSLWSLVPDYAMQKVETSIKQKPDFVEVDADFQALVSAYRTMESAYDKLDTYYRTGEYRTDDYKKIPALHKEFLDAYDAFAPIDARVSSGMILLTERVEASRLDSLKADGLKILYAREVFIRSSRKVIDYIVEFDTSTMNTIDKAKLDAMIATAATDYDTYLKEASDKVQVGKEFGAYSLSMFNSSAENFLSSVRKLSSIVGDPAELKSLKRQIQYTSPTYQSGTPEYTLNQFNNMINASNMSNR